MKQRNCRVKRGVCPRCAEREPQAQQRRIAEFAVGPLHRLSLKEGIWRSSQSWKDAIGQSTGIVTRPPASGSSFTQLWASNQLLK